MTACKKTVFKVLRYEGNRLYSSNPHLRLKKIEYCLNKITRPKIRGTPLFAFTNLNSAKKWIKSSLWNAVVYECKAMGARRWCPDAFPEFDMVRPLDSTGRQWRNWKSRVTAGVRFPGRGTSEVNWLLCETITPIRQRWKI